MALVVAAVELSSTSSRSALVRPPGPRAHGMATMGGERSENLPTTAHGVELLAAQLDRARVNMLRAP
jgi:hypothetical protein